MTPQQMEAQRRIDAIYADQSHPYWQGDPGATDEMAGYFETLQPESPSGVADTNGASSGGFEPRVGQSPEGRAARQKIDAIYGDQSHPYWQGDPGATEEMAGHFKVLNPAPKEPPTNARPEQRVPLPAGARVRQDLLAGGAPTTTRGAARRRKGFENYLGPHLSEGLRNVKWFLKTRRNLMSPRADIRDAVKASQASGDAFRRGEIGKGFLEGAYVPANFATVFWPGTASGYRRGMEGMARAVGRYVDSRKERD